MKAVRFHEFGDPDVLRELRVDVAARVPLSELPAVHAKAASGALSGKVIVLPVAA